MRLAFVFSKWPTKQRSSKTALSGSHRRRTGRHTIPHRLTGPYAIVDRWICRKRDKRDIFYDMDATSIPLVECCAESPTLRECNFPPASQCRRLLPTELSPPLGHPA